jgi:hypothetical protein
VDVRSDAATLLAARNAAKSIKLTSLIFVPEKKVVYE